MRILKLFLLVLFTISSQAQDYFPKNYGVKQSFKNHVAITNATIYASSTQKLEKATLLFIDGKILEVGTTVSIPKNATIIDATGKTVYASFIDVFSEFGIQKPTNKPERGSSAQYDASREGYYWNDHIKPDYNAFENLNYENKNAEKLRAAGFGTVLSHFNDGVIAGTGLLWTLNDEGNNATRILNNKISQHLTFNRSKFSRQSYPSSLMGSMALIRQVYHDAKWYGLGKSETKDLALENFNANKNLIQIFNAGDKLNSLRASKIAKEAGVKLAPAKKAFSSAPTALIFLVIISKAFSKVVSSSLPFTFTSGLVNLLPSFKYL